MADAERGRRPLAAADRGVIGADGRAGGAGDRLVHAADAHAIRADWATVGRDLRSVVGRLHPPDDIARDLAARAADDGGGGDAEPGDGDPQPDADPDGGADAGPDGALPGAAGVAAAGDAVPMAGAPTPNPDGGTDLFHAGGRGVVRVERRRVGGVTVTRPLADAEPAGDDDPDEGRVFDADRGH